MSYYGYSRINQTRAAETKSLGDVVMNVSTPSLLHPWQESGLGDFSVVGRGRPIGPPRWGVGGWLYGDSSAVAQGGVPIWGGLSDKEKTAIGLAVVGAFLWWTLGKKMPGSRANRSAKIRANRPSCDACKDLLYSTHRLHRTRNGKKICDACKEFGADAYTVPKKNPSRRRKRRK